jgi:hypothetical protein
MPIQEWRTLSTPITREYTVADITDLYRNSGTSLYSWEVISKENPHVDFMKCGPFCGGDRCSECDGSKLQPLKELDK